MSELAASSAAPASRGLAGLAGLAAPSPATTAKAAAPNGNGAPVHVDEADYAKCTNCKTCYQDLGEFFEKTTIMVDGVAKEVGHLKPHAFDHVTVTPELRARFDRVIANCDAEIIQ
jgi:pyruvate-ferredoxin/flavodoxin oxidoreductase